MTTKMTKVKAVEVKNENFHMASSNIFRKLRKSSEFYDMTLACSDSNGETIKAHKILLSAFSSVLKEMISDMTLVNPSNNLSIFFRGIGHQELLSILDFIYEGEVVISEDRFAPFLAIAEDLKIDNLSNIRISLQEFNQETDIEQKSVDVTQLERYQSDVYDEEMLNSKRLEINVDEKASKSQTATLPKIDSFYTQDIVQYRENDSLGAKVEPSHYLTPTKTEHGLRDYEIVNGNSGGKVYKKDDFGYYIDHRRQKKAKSGVHLRCLKRNQNCKARATVKNTKLIIVKDHNHPPCEQYFKILSFQQRIKSRAEAENISLKKIFDEESLMDIETAQHVSYESLAKTVQRRRCLQSNEFTTSNKI